MTPDYNPLCGIVTGMEHSGTTLLSQLLNAHPQVASGVECGLLLSNLHDYNRVRPWWDWLCGKEGWGWCLTPEDRASLLCADSFEEAYKIFARTKGKNNRDPYLRDLFQSSPIIYDKTPRYVFVLDRIMKKIDAPVVVTLKTWEEALRSHIKRGVKIRQCAKNYDRMLESLTLAISRYPQRVLIVGYESLAKDTNTVMKCVSQRFHLPGDHELSLQRYNERFGNYIVSRNSFNKETISYEAPDLRLDKAEDHLKRKYSEYFSEKLENLKRNSI